MGLRVARVRVVADPDRRAAEWVLSVGGAIDVRDNGRSRKVRQRDELPPGAFELTAVDVRGPKVTDDALAVFRDCRNLSYLIVQGPQVSDAGLAHFAACTQLDYLNLEGTGITDAGLAHFKRNAELTGLALPHTRISDAGLGAVAAFKRLHGVNLRFTNVTESGAKKLAAALPQCKIEWEASDPLAPRRFTNRLGMEFARVPKGKSWLGGGAGRPGDRAVEFKDDFYLGVHEVTQEEWQKITGSNPSHFSRTGGGRGAVKDVPDADLKRFPVENVSWEDIQGFLAKLNEQAQETGWVYRLPTGDEWEYACRGGPLRNRFESRFDSYFDRPAVGVPTGTANIKHPGGLKRPAMVGSYPPNPLGLHDMIGNVWELCADEVPYPEQPRGKPGRRLRGGFWGDGIDYCRAAGLGWAVATHRANAIGLRLIRVRDGR
jgi:formylglycine-generating enzyme required for sulfatase activity